MKQGGFEFQEALNDIEKVVTVAEKQEAAKKSKAAEEAVGKEETESG